MRITIYNEPSGGSIGGSEVAAAVLAGALAEEHEVRLVHYRHTMTRESLGDFAGVELTRVDVQLRPTIPPQKGPAWQVFHRMRIEREYDSCLSADCDLFIAAVHEPPPFCAAPAGILWVLFPFHPISEANSLKHAWYRRKLQLRLRGYQTKLANSAFSAAWARKRWATDCEVMFPPVDVDGLASAQPKQDRILSVGRFATSGHGKKQLEMLDAYADIQARTDHRWRYDTAGGAGSSQEDATFLESVRVRARALGAEVHVRIGRSELHALYGRAKIFWHAAGFSVDEEAEPERSEHFGIATVEAMAAGCVPVVVNKGGQREIVEHDVSGFLWNTLDELKEYTLRLSQDEALLERMSAAARRRAQMFSRKAFVARFRSVISDRCGRSVRRSERKHVLQAPGRSPVES